MRQLFRPPLAVLTASLLAASWTTAATAADKKVTIINATRHTMVFLYISRITPGIWPEDSLGEDGLKPGASVVVDLGTDDYCIYEFVGVLDTGEKVRKSWTNVCKVSSLSFTED